MNNVMGWNPIQCDRVGEVWQRRIPHGLENARTRHSMLDKQVIEGCVENKEGEGK